MVKRLDLNIDTPIRIYEITAGTIAIEKVKLAPLSDEDINLLHRLLQIKFEERTPEKVKSIFSPEDMKKLDMLVNKHIITIYYGGKYVKSGVYHVPNLIYRQVLEKMKEKQSTEQIPAKQELITKEEKKEQKIEKEKTKQEEKLKKEKEEISETDIIKKLNKEGFLVLQSESEAKELSDLIADKIRKNQVTGIRGFDKKYYIVKNSFVLKFQSKIKSILKSGPKSSDLVAKELGLSQEAVVALLTVLREEGEIIEKRKGTFALID